MRPIRHVIVPLDGSVFAESVLPLALDVARRAAARVTLVTVHTPPLPAGGAQGVPALDPGLDDALRADIRTYLDMMRHHLAADDPAAPPIDVAVRDGPVADAIAAHVAEHDADLVALSSHGRGGASRLLLGSVTEGLMRRLDVPALVVHPGTAPTPPSGTFRRVLVAIDGTEASARSADAAVAVAGVHGVEYTVLRVLTAGERAEGADAADWREEALRELGVVERRLRDHGADACGVARAHPRPAEAIVEYAADIRADLIAVATHTRGAVGRLLFGSVSDRVLRSATVPVLVRHAGAAAVGAAAVGAAAPLAEGIAAV